MRKSIILAAAVATIAAVGMTGTAFAKGGGPEGGHHWLQQNAAYAAAHPIKADYACRAGNVLVVQPTPCANGKLG